MEHSLCRKEEQVFQEMLEQFVMLIHLDHEGKFIYVNPAFCELTKYTFDELMGVKIHELGIDCTFLNNLQMDAKSSRGEQCSTKKSFLKGKDGKLYPVQLNTKLILDEEGFPFQYYLFVIQLHNNCEVEKWKYMAYRDDLTGLYNRRMLNDSIDSYINNSIKSNSEFAILFMDINYFKYINDMYGHLIGDLLLKEVGDRLKNLLKTDQNIFRYGGDEFVILLGKADIVESTAQSIMDLFNQPFKIKGHQLHVSIRIGISIYPEHGMERDDILNTADIAMLYSKQKAEGYEIFHNTSIKNDRGFMGRE